MNLMQHIREIAGTFMVNEVVVTVSILYNNLDVCQMMKRKLGMGIDR